MWLYSNDSVDATLKILGIEKLRDWQEEVMDLAYRGEDLFLSVPTSGGKSLVFQLLASLEAGYALTMVISPLRALQQDQVMQLTNHGVEATWLNSDLSNSERREILDNLSKYCLLYLAPEQLHSRDLNRALRKCHVERVVIDEAHVIPQEGFGFRKAYRRIGKFIRKLPNQPQIIACTATATPKERRAVIKSLKMDHPEIYTHPLRRDNLRLSVKKFAVPQKCKSKKEKLESLLFQATEATLEGWKEDGSKGSVIIYCPTVRRVKDLKRWLKGRGWRVAAYTGKMSPKKRLRAQEGFLSGCKKIIVATNGFGLGINKPDVRLVIHVGLPLTLNGYVQEIGRAGRDGKKAKCVLFYSDADFESNKGILKRPRNKEAIRSGIKGLNALKDLLDSPKCLWTGIEKYYGEKGSGDCGHCCNCKAKKARKQDNS